MMVEQGFMNNDPKMKLINLKWYIRTVLNAIIDQKIHAYGMTEKEMMEHIQVHAESAHGLKEIKPSTMEKVKAAIKPVTVTE